MGLQCLVVTCDPGLIGHTKTILSEHQASLDLRQDSSSAIEITARRHWDGVVIDCDDVPGGTQAIAEVRNSRSNRQTLIFSVINGLTGVDAALDLGANFVLSKPVQESRWRSILDVALPKMEREHRRYFRYDTDVPVRLWDHDGHTYRAKMKNVSEGGLAIKPLDPLRSEGIINLEFEVPAVVPQTFHAKADLAWSDSFVSGLQFLCVDKESEKLLRAWLESLEARARFRETLGTN
jgi:CheY-like chemotaxis protein